MTWALVPLLALLGLLSSSRAAAQEAATPAVDEEQLARWVAQLTDARWSVREQAMARIHALGKPALPAVRRAAAAARDPEARWRLRQLIRALDPAALFRPVLLRAAEGEVRAARVELAGILSELPRGTRPDPRWTLEILGDIERSSAGIAWLNFFFLLREAGIFHEPARQKAMAGLRGAGDARSLRLLAVMELHVPAEQKDGWRVPSKAVIAAASKLWERGVSARGAGAAYLDYERAMWAAHCGKTEVALKYLREIDGGRAAALRSNHLGEARKSADFFMLQSHPGFRAIVDPREPADGG